jgi:hypothetical protein
MAPTNKRPMSADDPSGDPAAAGNGDAQALDTLVKLRNSCLTKLNEIAARAYQQSTQASADLVRAVNEAQFNVQVAQQERFVDYVAAVQNASVRAVAPNGLNELAQQCARDLENAHATARRSIDDAQSTIATRVKESNDSANREWDQTCSAFVTGLNAELARSQAGGLDPAALVAIGQSLVWVAAQLRRT